MNVPRNIYEYNNELLYSTELVNDASLMQSVAIDDDIYGFVCGSAGELQADRFESNETFRTATSLTADKGREDNLTIHKTSDVDYYKITLTETGTASNFVQILFTHANGDLNIQLRNSYNDVIIQSYTTEDYERISLNGLAAGVYYARIYGRPSAVNVNSYSIEWNSEKTLSPDSYESNNTTATAANLPANKGRVDNLNIHNATDNDYYKITLTGTGTTANFVQALFSNAAGNLDMALCDAAGNVLLSSAATTADSERISLEGLAAGDYYVRVYGQSGAVNNYSLEWNSEKTLSPDSYESNNTTATAANLPANKGRVDNLNIHNATDNDYYKITLTGTGTTANFVQALFSNAAGNLDMALCDAAGNVLLSSAATTADSERISLEGLAAGDYYVRVYGQSGAVNNYSLEWNSEKTLSPDSYESNNTTATAANLPANKGRVDNLNIHNATDNDYYKITLTGTGTTANFVQALFSNAAGNLDMALCDAAGNVLLSSAATTADSERISLEGLAAGDYYVRVYGQSGAVNNYSLEWNSEKTLSPDSYESNNTTATAANLPVNKGRVDGLTIHNTTDTDYYKITLTKIGMHSNYVQALFSNADGNLGMALCDAAGNVLLSSISATAISATADSERISLEGLAAGDYYIKVYGQSGATNSYSLEWDGTGELQADRFESNETFRTATNLTADKGREDNLTIHNTSDIDYYKITLTETGTASNFVQILFTHANGDLNMQLRNSYNDVIIQSYTTEDYERISLNGLAAGVYYARIYGRPSAVNVNSYSIEWNSANDLSPDSYESNNTIATAASLPDNKGRVDNLSIHNTTDTDYYKITLTGTGTAANFVQALFSNAGGNLDMALCDAAGNVLLSSASTTADSERISLEGLAAGDYYIKIYGQSGATNSYSLEWDSAKSLSPDSYESNNTTATAASLTDNKGRVDNLSIHHTTDTDYYKITLAGTGTTANFVQALFSNAGGNLDMALCDAAGNVLLSSTSTTADSERISLEGLAAGDYYIKIYGQSGAVNNYSLEWDSERYLLPDSYESNETIATAASLPDNKGRVDNLSIHNTTDTDYYKITLTDTGTAANFVQALFSNAGGNLDMALCDAAGNVLLSSASTTADSERISLDGLAAGDYYIKVYGQSGVTNSYSLEWDSANSLQPDSYESNETIATAASLPDNKGRVNDLSIHKATDTDYYKITLTGTGTAENFVQALFSNASGNLDMALCNAAGTVLRSSTSATADSERISLDGLAAGDYYIKVYGQSGAVNNYSLEWDSERYLLPDSYESNETIATAASLPGNKGRVDNLSIHSVTDTDYYKITLTKTGMNSNYVQALFSNAGGNLDMALCDAAGNVLLSSTSATADSERISLDGLAAGDYYIKVYGQSGVTNSYSLEWDSANSLQPDSYEFNDNTSSAASLPANNGRVNDLSIHKATDIDYYKITLTVAGTAENFVQALFTNANGNLDMALCNAAGAELRISTSPTADSKRISLGGLRAGDYYIKVYGRSGATNSYSLEWDSERYLLPDSYESNETIATAANLPDNKGRVDNLSIHNTTDIDYYKITLAGTGTTENYVQALFSNAGGNLDMALCDVAGNVLRSTTSATADSERISLDGLAAGDYYIKVYGRSGATNNYNLSWDSAKYLQVDSYEYNNSTATASSLPDNKGRVDNLSIHNATDIDYYKITLTGTGTTANFVQALFSNAGGNLNMALCNAAGTVLRSSTSATADSERISLDGLAAGDYYIKIYGQSGATNSYSLEWDSNSYDRLEANDSIATAADLPYRAGSYPGLSIHSKTDVDYYKVNLLGIGMAQNYFQMSFTNSTGNLDVELYDSGGNLLRSSCTTADSERISLQGLDAGDYYIKVYGVDGAANTYNAQWDFHNYLPADIFEVNDSIATAASLPYEIGSSGTLTIHSRTDVDYYKVNLTGIGMAQNYFQMFLTNSIGNLDVELYDSDGNLLRSSCTTADSERISLQGLDAGDYYIKVYGVGGAYNTYTLGWNFHNYLPADIFEVNDSIATAASLPYAIGSSGILTIHSRTDVDYYKVNLTGIGVAQNYFQMFFTNSIGNLDVELYDSGGNLLRSSCTTADSERISLQGLDAGDYYIKVYGVGGAYNTYTLGWNFHNYLPTDIFEVNDSIATAAELPYSGGFYPGLAIHNKTDVDYYKVNLAGIGMVENYFSASFTNAIGNLDVELYDSEGNLLRSSCTTADSERISLQGLDAGTYYIKVYGVDGAYNSYNLDWNFHNYLQADHFEDNDSIATAKAMPFTSGWYTEQTIHSRTDVDYYKITLKNKGLSSNVFTVEGINLTGDLEMKLYDAAGIELRSSIFLAADQRQFSFQGLAPGTYYVKISGVDGAYGRYNLRWSQWAYLPNMSDRVEIDAWSADKYENNNSIASASTIMTRASRVGNLTIHNIDGSDVDYYKITLTNTGSAANYARILFSNGLGKVDMALYDAAGNVVRSSSVSQDSAQINFEGLSSGSYYLKVYGTEGSANTYSLSWNRSDASATAPSILTATTLTTTGNSLNNIVLSESNNVNYYKFSLGATGTTNNYLSINSANNLYISILDAAGRVLSECYTDYRTKLNLNGLDSGTYYLKVRSEDIINASSQYNINYDILSSASADKAAGAGYYSLFSMNSSNTEYAYIMGQANLSLADFNTTYPYSRMSYSNDLIIDAEKCGSNYNDDNQCWAATASNMLVWSGWAEHGVSSAIGNNAEDVIFAEYSKYFPNQAAIIQDGIRWFFESEYLNYVNSVPGAAGSGNYLGVSTLPGLTCNDITGVSSIYAMTQALASNMAVGLSMGTISHAINVWGYTFDITKNQDDPNYYTGLFITDSNEGSYEHIATDVPDTLQLFSLTWDSSTQHYYTTYHGITTTIDSFVTLDHRDNWGNGAAGLGTVNSGGHSEEPPSIGNGRILDSLLANAVLPSAGTIQVSSELADSNGRYKQTGMLSA